jgi:hypothetical protein
VIDYVLETCPSRSATQQIHPTKQLTAKYHYAQSHFPNLNLYRWF